MSENFSKRCTTDPRYAELLNCLINKSKNAKSPINIQQLIRDFKENSGTALTDTCLKSRIERMRAVIHCFEHIDKDTKVRMLFALSAPVNRYFLQELSNDAFIVVDGNNRITHYKSERLELKGYHRLLTTCDNKNSWTTDMECIDLLNYLIEATENVKSPMNLAQLARDFKEKSGSLQTAESLEQRIERLRTNIHSFEHIDEKEKVKLLFALSAPVYPLFLRKLRERAFVQVDKQNRITYYKAINGGLELRGDHSLAAKLTTGHLEPKCSHRPPAFETPNLSKRKADSWVTSSSKRTLSSPDYNSLELLADYDTNYSIDNEVKLELFHGSVQEDLNGVVDDKDIQQIPKPMETPIKIEVEEPIEIKPETFHNSKTQFFEAMQSLILCLDTPSLSWIESKIHQKIQKIRGLDEVIGNNEIFSKVELLIARVANRSVLILSRNVESVNLSNFLCYLKASILNSKMSGVEGLVKNISKLIEESQNKEVPMGIVENSLRATLIIEGF